MVLKQRERKAVKLASDKKQMTFDVPESDVYIERKKPVKKTMTTYWRCKKNHIFPLNFKVHPDRISKLRCSVCTSHVENQSHEAVYLDYLNEQGRGDKLKWRKRSNKMHTEKKKKT